MANIKDGNFLINLSDDLENSFSCDFKGTGSSIKIGKNTKLKVKFVLSNNCEVIIGDNFIIRGEIRAVHTGSRVLIGNNVKFNNECRLHAAEGRVIEVRSGCLFSNVRFRTSDSHSIVDSSGDGVRINPAADILIEENVWIAEDVKVYKGVTIGRGSVIGASSTVVKSIPEYSLGVGNPAKIVKNNISWKEQLI